MNANHQRCLQKVEKPSQDHGKDQNLLDRHSGDYHGCGNRDYGHAPGGEGQDLPDQILGKAKLLEIEVQKHPEHGPVKAREENAYQKQTGIPGK